jgi:hypothetical protein
VEALISTTLREKIEEAVDPVAYIASRDGKPFVRFLDKGVVGPRPGSSSGARYGAIGQVEVPTWEDGADLAEKTTGRRPTRRAQPVEPSLEVLREAAKRSENSRGRKPKKVRREVETFDRSGPNKAYVVARAQGVCECGCGVPWPRLQGAHIHALKDGGDDVIENMLALRPDCHDRTDNEPEFNAEMRLLAASKEDA